MWHIEINIDIDRWAVEKKPCIDDLTLKPILAGKHTESQKQPPFSPSFFSLSAATDTRVAISFLWLPGYLLVMIRFTKYSPSRALAAT